MADLRNCGGRDILLACVAWPRREPLDTQGQSGPAGHLRAGPQAQRLGVAAPRLRQEQRPSRPAGRCGCNGPGPPCSTRAAPPPSGSRKTAGPAPAVVGSSHPPAPRLSRPPPRSRPAGSAGTPIPARRRSHGRGSRQPGRRLPSFHRQALAKPAGIRVDRPGAPAPGQSRSAARSLLEQYRSWMESERGLSAATVLRYENLSSSAARCPQWTYSVSPRCRRRWRQAMSSGCWTTLPARGRSAFATTRS